MESPESGRPGRMRFVANDEGIRPAGHVSLPADVVGELRKRLIRDHYTDTTGSNDSRWWGCRVCEWVWRHGDKENHDVDCPMPALRFAAQGGESDG